MKDINISLSSEHLTTMFGEKPSGDILRSISKYRAKGFNFDLLEYDPIKKIGIFDIKQVRLINGFILNNQQLYDRAKEVFDFETDFKIHIKPRVFEPPLNEINIEWSESKMKDLGLTIKDISKQLAIDKASLSRIFSGEVGMTKSFKAALYYYFLQYEINRDLRHE